MSLLVRGQFPAFLPAFCWTRQKIRTSQQHKCVYRGQAPSPPLRLCAPVEQLIYLLKPWSRDVVFFMLMMISNSSCLISPYSTDEIQRSSQYDAHSFTYSRRFLYNRSGEWSDGTVPILATTAAGFTYISFLMVSPSLNTRWSFWNKSPDIFSQSSSDAELCF